ncbi:Lactaldehyde dehydrogenase [Candidatus Methanobinarius endosymbioticus]|uniref:Lactaldehyde dehydrogenase n=1 Tax=Candidatus Methanobinarius endosymbioticus TaxID=2006182 RepID=A0A366MDA4_9EURY|nr:Lactaldehyde dehydrogenase [Candidatus Methanobinarius endosymbioticus]
MKMLINGKFEEKEESFKVINPYNNELVDKVPIGDRSDVKKAILAANQAKKKLQDMSSRKVSENLYSAYETLKSEKQKLAKVITEETGKPIKDSLGEMERSVETLKFAAEESKRIYGETIPLDAGIGGKGFFAVTQKIPLGVVAAITPFNYPVNLAIHKIAPAIASKNTTILKPSLQAPIAALRMAEIIASEFPDGVVNTVTGYGGEIGDELTVNEDIDKISFTGSVATGLLISTRAGMKKITLELGGNDPLVILEDANIEKAVKAAILGSYLYSGQVCIAVKRIIIDEKIANEFVDLFAKETEKLKIGDPMDPETDIGPLINENAAKMVEQSVVEAYKKGAKRICGGNRDGNYFEPTILDNITPDMNIVINETFGPISPIIRVNGVEEAISVANDSEFGLQAGVFTEGMKNGLKCVNEIDAGSVFINKQPTFRTDNMPFGGFKMSGMGKEGIKYAVDDMTRTKLIAMNLR